VAARIDLDGVRRAAREQAGRVTPGLDDMVGFLAAQVRDTTHREVVGPLHPAAGASGVVLHRGGVLAQWGDPTAAEMCFSVTKTFLSLVAGVAFTDGRLDPEQGVHDAVGLAELAAAPARRITWRHLLQQTSGWTGVLWGKPTAADAQSGPSRFRPGRPGAEWAYNDVRVNLLALALTALLGRGLPDVLRERLTDPVGASRTWSWAGYDGARAATPVGDVPVVSGGAHWGGGLRMSALDLALVGELVRRGGRWDGERLLDPAWIDLSWTPCPVKPDYGLLWWLNDRATVLPAAPPTGRCARGNRTRHLLWIDPARDLVVASHWGEDVGRLLAGVSAAVPSA
jgi:CubicO group peptidase (beta-lactamase class C family)